MSSESQSERNPFVPFYSAGLGLGTSLGPAKSKRANNPAKYTGELAKRMSKNGPKEGELERKIELLYAHHGVKEGNWSGLAIALAFAHVPGLQHSRSGRKPSAKTTAKRVSQYFARMPNQLLAWSMMPPSVNQPRRGRPNKNADQDRKLVRSADKWRKAQKDAGARRHGDRAYVEANLTRIFADKPAWLSELARDYKTTKGRAFKKHLGYWAARLSRARKSVAKTAGN